MASEALRVFKGWVGNKFRFRQSLPGKNAETGPIEDMIFDADYGTGLLLNKGETTIDTGYVYLVPGGAGSYSFPKTIPHYCGRKPDVIIAVARPENASGVPQNWNSFQPHNFSFPYYGIVALGNTNMNGRYSGPFQCSDTSSGVGGASSGSYGWRFSCDENNITFTTFQMRSGNAQEPNNRDVVRVKWLALRVK